MMKLKMQGNDESQKVAHEGNKVAEVSTASGWNEAQWDITLWTTTLDSSGIPYGRVGSCGDGGGSDGDGE